MRNIEFVNRYVIQFYKPWTEEEKDIANCIGMRIDNHLILADTRVVSPHSVKDFMVLCFPYLMLSDSNKQLRDSIFSNLKDIYSGIYKDFLATHYRKTGYSRELFNHQKRALSLMIHRQHNLLSFEPGLGKTITSASLSKILGIPRTIVICPSIVKWNWYHDMTDDWGYDKMLWTILDSKKSKSIYAFNERFVVVNYEMIDKHFHHLTKFNVGHIIIDECFPYKTPIITDKGVLFIGDIVENKINCNALSCDLSSNVLSFQKIVFHHKNKRKNEFIKIKHSGGEFTCTRNHKIYVEKVGYKRADELLVGDNLRTVWNKPFNKVQGEGYDEILLDEMLVDIQKKFPRMAGVPKEIVRCSNEVQTKKGSFLRNMFCKIQCNTIIKTKVLLNKLLCKMENGSRQYKGEGLYKRAFCEIKKYTNIVSSKKSRKEDGFISTNEKRQSNVETRYKREDDSIKQGKNFFEQRREWTTNKAADCPIGINWTTNGTRHKYKGCASFIQKCTESLQSRFSLCRKENSDRSGWGISQTEKMEVFRQKEDRDFKLFRVESIEILERGDRREPEDVCGEDYVYNIEVEKNHNYFANDILVSNCQYVKNTKTARFKSVQKLVKHFPKARVTLLSGTPITNRVNDIFAYFRLCGHPLGRSYKAFVDRYTINQSGRGGVRIIGAQNIDELRLKISNFMIRKKTEECIDLPQLFIKKYYFEMGDVKGEYEQHVKELYAFRNDLDNSKSTQEQSEIKMKIKGNIHTLNRLLATSKVRNIIPLIDNLVENGRDVIVFSGYRDPINMLEKHYGNDCVKVIGGIDSSAKDDAIQKFTKNPNCKIFLGNFKAAGVGINLVNSRDVIFLNFPFTPDDLEQSYKRAHRTGQKETVNVYYTMVKESIDIHIFDMIVGKTKDINSVLDEGREGVVHYNQIPNELFNRLIHQYEKEHHIKGKEFVSLK